MAGFYPRKNGGWFYAPASIFNTISDTGNIKNYKNIFEHKKIARHPLKYQLFYKTIPS